MSVKVYKYSVNRIRKVILSFAVMVFFSLNSMASLGGGSLKSNILSDATGTLNLGLEFPFSHTRKWSTDLSGSLNAWKFSQEAFWKNAYVQPELRYWLCDYSSGHFFGLHLHGGIFNIGKINDYRFQGWFVGAGLGYGYAFVLDEHWNIELEAGVGYAYAPHDKYECETCGDTIYKGQPYDYWGMTKLAVSLVYFF